MKISLQQFADRALYFGPLASAWIDHFEVPRSRESHKPRIVSGGCGSRLESLCDLDGNGLVRIAVYQPRGHAAGEVLDRRCGAVTLGVLRRRASNEIGDHGV